VELKLDNIELEEQVQYIQDTEENKELFVKLDQLDTEEDDFQDQLELLLVEPELEESPESKEEEEKEKLEKLLNKKD